MVEAQGQKGPSQPSRAENREQPAAQFTHRVGTPILSWLAGGQTCIQRDHRAGGWGASPFSPSSIPFPLHSQ